MELAERTRALRLAIARGQVHFERLAQQDGCVQLQTTQHRVYLSRECAAPALPSYSQ